MVNLQPIDAEISIQDHLQVISYLKLFHLPDSAYVNITAASNYLSVYFDNNPTEFRWSKPAVVTSSNTMMISVTDLMLGYRTLKKLGIERVKYHLTLDNRDKSAGMGSIQFYIDNICVATNRIETVLASVTPNKDISIENSVSLDYMSGFLKRYKSLYRKASSQSSNLVLNRTSGYVYTDFWESDYLNQDDDLHVLLYPREWDILTRVQAIDSNTKYVTHDKLIIAYTDDVLIQLSTGYLLSAPELHGDLPEDTALEANFNTEYLGQGAELASINGDSTEIYYDTSSDYVGYSGLSLTGNREPALVSKLHIRQEVLDAMLLWCKGVDGATSIKMYDQGYRMLICLQDSVSTFVFRAVKL